MDPAELELDGPPVARFEDLETGDLVSVRPRELRAAYNDTVRRVIEAWRSQCRRNGIAYHHVLTDTPFGYVLRRATVRRTRLA